MVRLSAHLHLIEATYWRPSAAVASGLDTLEQQLLAFGRRYEQIAAPSNGRSPALTSTASPSDSTDQPPRPPDHEYVGELQSQST